MKRKPQYRWSDPPANRSWLFLGGLIATVCVYAFVAGRLSLAPMALIARALAVVGFVKAIGVIRTRHESTPEQLFNPVQHDWLSATQYSVLALIFSARSQPETEGEVGIVIAIVAVIIQMLALWVAYYSRLRREP